MSDWLSSGGDWSSEVAGFIMATGASGDRRSGCRGIKLARVPAPCHNTIHTWTGLPGRSGFHTRMQLAARTLVPCPPMCMTCAGPRSEQEPLSSACEALQLPHEAGCPRPPKRLCRRIPCLPHPHSHYSCMLLSSPSRTGIPDTRRRKYARAVPQLRGGGLVLRP